MRKAVLLGFGLVLLLASTAVIVKPSLFNILGIKQTSSTEWVYLVGFTVSNRDSPVTYLTLSSEQMYGLYQKLEELLGKANIQLVVYTRSSDGLTGFTAKLTQSAVDNLPNNPTEHAEWDSVFGYHLNYSKQEYIGRIPTPDSFEDVFSCSADSDCTLVTADCCGCASGGGETAVSKKYQIYWENKIQSECNPKHPFCLAVYMCEPHATAICDAGRCSYKVANSED